MQIYSNSRSLKLDTHEIKHDLPAALGTVFWYISVVCLISVMYAISSPNLPDYVAYQYIFNHYQEFSGWNFIFPKLVASFHFFGFGYTAFRIAIISLALIFFALIKKQKMILPWNSGRTQQSNLIYFVLLSVFLLEFFLVRLRAGISILLFSYAIVLGFSFVRDHQKMATRLIQLLLFSFSAFFHPATFVVLFLLMLLPFIWSIHAGRWIKFSHFSLFLIMVVVWMAGFVAISTLAVARGPLLYSNLNIVRLFAFTILPICVFVVERIFLKNEFRRVNSIPLSNYFPATFSVGYLALAVAMTILAPFGVFDISGEAVVRIVTLTSVPAILILARFGISKCHLLPIYLATANALFFLKSLYF